MSDFKSNQVKLAELMAQVNALKAQESRAAEQAAQARIDDIRNIDPASDLYTLLAVAERHDVRTVGELIRIIRMRSSKDSRALPEQEVIEVIRFVRSYPGSSATEIVSGTQCSDDTPRRMAATGQLISYGKARATRYSLGTKNGQG